MNTLRLSRSRILAYGAPASVILVSVALAMSPLLDKQPELAIGITYDLTLTAPILYFLLVRKSKISNLTVVPIFVLGIILATLLLPAQQQTQLDYIKTYVFPVVELTVLTLVGTKIYRGVRSFRTHADTSSDFYSVIKKSTTDVLGETRVASLFSTEIAALYYAFFSWKRREPADNEFTGYKESGSVALFCALLGVVLIETFVLHILLVTWSPAVAWVVTILSLYSAVQIIGHVKAMSQRYGKIEGQKLVLKYGLFGDVLVDLRDIERVEKSGEAFEGDERKVERLSLLQQLEMHNVVLYFKKPQLIESAYGIKKTCDILLLHVDAADVFVRRLSPANDQ